jgi:hypothetical protein
MVACREFIIFQFYSVVHPCARVAHFGWFWCSVNFFISAWPVRSGVERDAVVWRPPLPHTHFAVNCRRLQGSTSFLAHNLDPANNLFPLISYFVPSRFFILILNNAKQFGELLLLFKYYVERKPIYNLIKTRILVHIWWRQPPNIKNSYWIRSSW